MDKIITIKYYINYLRNKGSQIELLIEVHFCYDTDKDYDTGKFILGNEEKTFNEIKLYLIKVKKYYMKLLTRFYLNDECIRFAYGKQFNFIVSKNVISKFTKFTLFLTVKKLKLYKYLEWKTIRL